MNSTIKNTWKHFCLVTRHRYEVFKLCCRAGIPIRGLLHDLSKYSPSEFFEGVKYYSGDISPITMAKMDKGYSLAFIHHTNHNKHHVEYWYDMHFERKAPMMPFKYAVELICDKIAAGKIYTLDKFDLSEPLEFFLKCDDKKYINENMYGYIKEALEMLRDKGIKYTINKKRLWQIYNKYYEKELEIERKRKNENI